MNITHIFWYYSHMSETTNRLGELIARITRDIRRRSRTLPLAPHLYRALRIISTEPVRPARLAEKLNVTPRAVTGVVDSLTQMGLAQASADPADRRAKIVSSTQEGRDFVEKTAVKRAEIAHDVFGVLSASEQNELLRLLEKVEEIGRASCRERV